MGISKVWDKAVVVAGCLGVMASAAHAGYDENVGAATGSSSSNMGGSMSRSDMRMRNAQMLVQTLSEERTEINSLAGQREVFLRMGGSENRRIAQMWAVWINEHKAASPTLIRLIRVNGGDPTEARILKAPPLGNREQMLMATHRDHMAAVMTSQTRFYATTSPSIRAAMHKRANLARKHLRQMAPFHRDMNMNMGGNMNMNGGMGTTSGGGMDMNTDSSMDNSTDSTTTTTTTTTTDTTSTDSGTMGTTESGTTESTTTTDSGTMGTVESGTDDSTTNDTGGLTTGTNDGTMGSADDTTGVTNDTGGLTTGTNDGTTGSADDSTGTTDGDTGGLTTGTNDAGNGTMNGQ